MQKIVDSWKTKNWYVVIAPKFLGEVEVARVPARDEGTLMNRVITLPLKEISHDVSHMYTNIRLRVSEIKGKSAFTKFIGHEVSREFLGTLVRRRREALSVVFPVTSKDGVRFTIKTLVVTGERCSERQKTALHNALKQELTKRVSATEFGKFIQETLYGRLGSELAAKLHKIAPLRRVEIRKTELYEEFDTAEVQKMESREEAPAQSEQQI